MKVWLTATEIADAAVEGRLPGLPTTQRGVQKRAVAEGWDRYGGQCRRRKGREGGGGLEYHIDLLPAPARLHYLSSFVSIATPAARAELTPSIPEGDALTTAGRKNRDARLAILKAADRYRDGNGLSSVASDGFFVLLYNAGQAEIAPWVRPLVGRLSVRSLARWRAAAKTRGTEALGYDPALNRKDTGVLSRAAGGEVKTFILALLAKNQFLSSDHIRNAVIDRFAVSDCLDVAGRPTRVPSRRTFQLQLSQWRGEYANALLKIRDPDGYRSRVEMVALGTSRADRLNECWQIDASPLDAIMLSGKRQVIYAAVDVFSRSTIILVTATPRAEAVAMLVRKCLKSWGVPERIKTDNGSDFTAHATQRLLGALGIEIELSPPYSPRSKPLVERVIGTFQRDFAATIPGFVGHNVGQRSIIEKRKAFSRRLSLDDAHLFDADMSEAEVAAYADSWAAEIYAHSLHDGIGMTPFAKAASHAGPVRRISDERALDILVAPVVGGNGIRTVGKTGIRVSGEAYYIGTVPVGRQVLCRMDPADLGRLMVFEPDGETFLGIAECPALLGLDPVETAMRVKAQQQAMLEGQLKPIRAAMRKIGPRAVADAQLNVARARHDNLVAFPRPAEGHSTPALDAAAAAARPV
ncbi:transposase, partial [Devosia sp.]|uniref:transposase n=1 Tax=Devosia sp. TaxID=1871048 RepID=UPI0035B489CD